MEGIFGCQEVLALGSGGQRRPVPFLSLSLEGAATRRIRGVCSK